MDLSYLPLLGLNSSYAGVVKTLLNVDGKLCGNLDLTGASEHVLRFLELTSKVQNHCGYL
jgi:hypothetical protein